MMTFTTSGRLMTLGLATLLMTGCTNKEQTQPTPDSGTTPAGPGLSMKEVGLRMKWVAYGNYAGDIAGEKWGIWKKHGLDVKVHQGGPGIMATQIVASGTDHFGTTGADELAIAIEQGLPLVAIAAQHQWTPVGYLAHPESDIRSPKDFAGKRFKVIPGHNSWYEYRVLLKKFGVDRASVTEIVNKASFQLWLKHEVDIEPIYVNLHTTQADHRGYPYRLLRAVDFGIKNYGNVIFTTRDMVEQHPDVVEVFLRGFWESWEACWKDVGKCIDACMEVDPALDKAEEMDVCTTWKDNCEREDGRWGWMERKVWEESIAAWADAGILQKAMDPDKVFTNRFNEKLYADLTTPISPVEVPPFRSVVKKGSARVE